MTVCGLIVLVLACWLVGSFLLLVFSKSHLWENVLNWVLKLNWREGTVTKSDQHLKTDTFPLLYIKCWHLPLAPYFPKDKTKSDILTISCWLFLRRLSLRNCLTCQRHTNKTFFPNVNITCKYSYPMTPHYMLLIVPSWIRSSPSFLHPS